MRKIRIFSFIFLFFFTAVSFGAQSVDVESLKISHKTTVVTVTTTATALPATPLAGRKVILVQNISTSVVYLGNADVTADETSTGGFQLQDDSDTWVGDFTEDVIVYARVSSGTAPVVVWEAR